MAVAKQQEKAEAKKKKENSNLNLRLSVSQPVTLYHKFFVPQAHTCKLIIRFRNCLLY
ncbi:MAG: hypothetical protein ACI90V_012787 [Bacillariaceae sp.]|jgi:hypothetical protein